MKYSKNEAKEAAKAMLKGVWTALPTNFTQDDRIDEAAMAWNLEHCISDLQLDGHYCHGNVAEFWTMTNEERMRIHEINVEVAKGRVPLIAGCHHQNPNEVIKLAQHAQSVGIDFVIILTPYVAARGDDAIFEFYKYVCERIDIGVVLFNTEATHPISADVSRKGSPSCRTSARSSRACPRSRPRSRCGPPSARRSRSASPTRRLRVQPERDGRSLAAQLLPAPLPGAGIPAGERLHRSRQGRRLQQGRRNRAQPEPAAHRARSGFRATAGRAGACLRTSRNTGWS